MTFYRSRSPSLAALLVVAASCAHSEAPAPSRAERVQHILHACALDNPACGLCRAGALDECINAADGHDDQQWTDILAYACEEGGAAACAVLGAAIATGDRGHTPDPQVGGTLALRSCAMTPGSGCRTLARLSLIDRAVLPPAALRRAVTGYCEAKNPGACFLLGVLLEGGHGGDMDLPAAYAAFTRACELGEDRACVYQQSARLLGIGIEPDEAGARAELQRRCDDGDPVACDALTGTYPDTSLFGFEAHPPTDLATRSQIGARFDAGPSDRSRSVRYDVCVSPGGQVEVNFSESSRDPEIDRLIARDVRRQQISQPTRAGRPVRACQCTTVYFASGRRRPP